MKAARVFFPSALNACAALIGGRAARTWRFDLACKAARRSGLKRGSAWVDALGAVCPRLWEGPLMGAALASLAAGVPAPPPDTARPRAVASGRRGLAPLPERRRPRAAEAAEQALRLPTAARRQAPGPRPGHGGPAARPLLERLAGGPAALDTGGLRPARSFPLQPMVKPEAGDHPPAAGEPTDLEQWMGRLARRAGRVLNRGAPAAAETPEPEEGGGRPGHPAEAVEPGAVSLDGPKADPALLERIARRIRPEEAETSAAPPGGTSQRAEASIPGVPTASRAPRHPEAVSGPPDALAGGRPEFAAGGRASGRRRPADAAGRLFESLGPVLDGGRALPGDGGDSKFAPKIVRPNTTPALPPLLPPQETDAPLQPVAALTARRGARREAMRTLDDLDALAEAVERILEDQARRHGIDV